jgi:hypothetical protein
MTDQRQHAAHDCLDRAVQPRDAPGGLSEPVLSAALCGSMEGHLAAPGQRVSGDTNAPMPSPPLRPRDGDALVARDGRRTLAEGATVELKPGETATRAPIHVRVI